MQTAKLVIKIAQPRGHAGDMAFGLVRLFGNFNRRQHRISQRHESALYLPGFGELEQARFGLFDRRVRVLIKSVRERFVDDLLAERDQFAAQMKFVNCARVIGCVDDGDDAGRQLGEIFGAADMGQVLILFKIAFQRDRAGRLAAFDQFDDRLKNALVRRGEEMAGFEKLPGFFQRAVINQQRMRYCCPSSCCCGAAALILVSVAMRLTLTGKAAL